MPLDGTDSCRYSDAGLLCYGAGWGDSLNGENWVQGSIPGTANTPGPCLINCTNLSEAGFYSFHSNGVNVVMCDGSVRFLSSDVAVSQICFMITASKGEVVTE